MDMIAWLLLSLLFLQKEIQCQYPPVEASLRTAILAGYDTDIRPSPLTMIKTSLGLMSLNKLDMNMQTMSLTAFWYMNWQDDRLQWDPATYSGITQIVLDHKKIWKPPLIVKNEVGTIGLIDVAGVPVRVFATGQVLWVLPITMDTTCEMNVQNYPFDRQQCSVQLSGWGYSNDEINLLPSNEPVNTFLYIPQGEWNFVTYSVIVHNDSDETNSYRTLKFYLRFERRWLFYGQYLLLPIMLNSVLMISVFLVPLDSGEKLGFTLTVLLSYVVLLTIVTGNLPPISTNTSVLQIYLSILMIIGTVATLLTIWILSLYNQGETQHISPIAQKFTNYIIAPVAGSCIRCKRKNNVHNYSSGDDKYADSQIGNKENVTMENGRPPGTASECKSSPRDTAWCPHKDKRMSYKDVALLLDIFFFRVSAVGLSILTVLTMTFLFMHN